MSDFFAMGGYAPYVWSAYGITLFVLILNGWLAGRKHRLALRLVRDAGVSDEHERKPTVKVNK